MVYDCFIHIRCPSSSDISQLALGSAHVRDFWQALPATPNGMLISGHRQRGSPIRQCARDFWFEQDGSESSWLLVWKMIKIFLFFPSELETNRPMIPGRFGLKPPTRSSIFPCESFFFELNLTVLRWPPFLPNKGGAFATEDWTCLVILSSTLAGLKAVQGAS